MENEMVKPKNLEMYFNFEVAASFAEREQNEKNFRVAEIVDRLAMNELSNSSGRLHIAELGGGAHPDRYHNLFKRLLKNPQGRIDWVDFSPVMLKLAKKYIDNKDYSGREEVIHFVEQDILKYLSLLDNNKLDLAIMKYTFDHISNIDRLFSLLAKKLKRERSLVATLTTLSPELKSLSTNARFLYKGKEFPDNETRKLKDGDSFTVKYFKESNNPSAGYLPGAETIKYYHSSKKIKELARKHKFDIFLGDWKSYLPENKKDKETIDQDVLILGKK